MDNVEREKSLDDLVAALNVAEPAVFCLMDYWTFDGWFALKERTAAGNAPPLQKRVFPGIELRLVSPTSYRLNAHVIFSDELSDQALSDFKSQLTVALIDRPLSDECLKDLARTKIGSDQLAKLGFKPGDVKASGEVAHQAGAMAAEIDAASFLAAVKTIPKNKALIFMPWSTSDGLSGANWSTHYAYVKGLMGITPIFETRDVDIWSAFSGVRTSGNNKWFSPFQAALDNIPRLAIAGSDAHRFADYGKFPSGIATWIKADPTFLGLLQAVKEPAKRCYLGKRPPKLEEVDNNKTFYVDSISIGKKAGSTLKDDWLSGCALPLNPDLVAIVGNKGSGKSALADVLALLGNSRSTRHFSFLNGQRFRAAPASLAKNFLGRILWKDGTAKEQLLSEDAPSTEPELVRYIPQAFFEELCNAHASGRSNVFEQELRAVIFSHTNPSIRKKALNFEQLIEAEESSFRASLSELRKELATLNLKIEQAEIHLAPEKRTAIASLLELKDKAIAEHEKVKPTIAPKPTQELTPTQQAAATELEGIGRDLAKLDIDQQLQTTSDATSAEKQRAIKVIRERLDLMRRQFKQFQDDIRPHTSVVSITPESIATLNIDESGIEAIDSTVKAERLANSSELAAIPQRRELLKSRQVTLALQLNEPQQRYQESLVEQNAWQGRLNALIGQSDTPDSREGIKAQLAQLDVLPETLIELRARRVHLTSEIFNELAKQRSSRELLYQPVQELIDTNELIRDDYKLQFRATIAASVEMLTSRMFEIIKQNYGDFRGEAESYAEVRRIAEKYSTDKEADVLQLIDELMKKIQLGRSGGPLPLGIVHALRVNKTAAALYDFLFGLEYLETRYTLLFQETQIEHLSPGQRGALLLIFYLLVDKGHNPIILDQPEENLDNETIVSLLIPVLLEAKKRRQILMVTHNPNLAVVCDAEQIICASFTRKSGSCINYASGSIEDPGVNRRVVDVLEGTKPAFENRGGKYH